MPYYAYCILRLAPDQEWTVSPGVAERPVFPVREGRLVMLVSRLEGNFSANAHSIIQHGRAVHRVFEKHTVLPFRFGTVFESEKQVRQVLLANRAEFREAMNRLRDKVEMHVKLLFATDGTRATGKTSKAHHPPPEPELTRRATRRLAGLFEPLEEQISVRPLQNGDALVHFAHLIEGSQVSHYQRIYSAAAGRMKDCQLLLSGPWPPSHFLPLAIRIPAASEPDASGRRRMPRRVTAAPQARAARA